MKYLIDVKEMLEKKSRVLIFIAKNKTDRTTKIQEAGKWEGEELNKILEDSPLSILEESSLKKLRVKNDTYQYNRYIRKYLSAGE